ncbi:MAG: hypothetical protein NTV43_14945 [Methylococcales bacterium]|nr:hypothetical protein [Methylococcales bacterium]
MQTVELNNLNLSLLPENAQQELIDYYHYLSKKYGLDQDKSLVTNPTQDKTIHALKGVFNQYAVTSKTALENSAWQEHLLNKHRHD